MFTRPRLALLLYAVAMGYLEAAVVVYLLAIYYPSRWCPWKAGSWP